MASIDISNIQVGLLTLFIKHTSASLTLNENCDPAVTNDMEMAFNNIVPESKNYTHDEEGPDDMPAHVKSSLLGSSVTIPISNGRLELGTWQGIWLCEHRNLPTARSLIATINGE
jgi:secondary thiamine-phosphate synthase enzyme